MSDDQGLIILGRKDGPIAGTTEVTVDAPGFVQAAFIVNTSLVGTPEEERVLRRMLEERRNIAQAVEEVQF